jgi:UDP-galactopyranose mutase
MRRFDWLIVGAGLSGATLAERIASQLGQRVLVVDRRAHVAGNAYDATDEAGVRVHEYGAHIFHTSSEQVWRYLAGFTTWLPYEHRVLASVDGRLVPLPFNLNTIDALFPQAEARRLGALLLANYGPDARVPVLRLLEHPDPALTELGQFVYDKVFLNYTVKQWQLRPEELDRAVTGRVPVLVGRDDRYFRDPHQGIPTDGYTAMVRRMLGHPNITVQLGVAHTDLDVEYRRMVYTGPIDEYFDHAWGRLPYRSLRFDTRTVATPRHQPVAVVNYPNEHDYTRIIEHRHFTPMDGPATTITYEYPQAHRPGETEPLYPVPTPDTRVQYRRYATAAEELGGRVLFVGRLAHYRYYDMDQAVAHALQAFKQQVVGGELVALPELAS